MTTEDSPGTLTEHVPLRFGDLLVDGVRNGIYKPKEYHGRGAKIVNMGELFAFPRLRDVEMRRVQLTERESEVASLQPGDLLFARRSLVAEGAGKCSIVLESNELTTFESSIIRARPNPECADSLFLYYWFNSPAGRHQIGSILRQTAVSGITGSDLVNLMVDLPPLSEQRAIAHVLGTLDDKIELNRQMNRTLEEIARTLFTSWFVRFDPVRAKAEGRQPEGMDAETAALFPDRFVDSELGPIPEGWRTDSFTTLASVLGGGTPKTSVSEYWNGDISWFAMADLPKDGSPFVISTEKQITEAGEAGSSAKRISRNSTILTARGTVGETILAGAEMAFNQSCYALQPATGALGPYTLFLLTRSQVDVLRSRAHGSVFSTITRATLDSLIVPIPEPAILDATETAIAPHFKLMLSNSRESATLAELRDTLLPELLSGRVRAPVAAEKCT